MLNYRLMTKYGESHDGNVPLAEYPRPQLVRDSYINLNGEWELTVLDRGATVKKCSIILPFPPESALSGVCDKDIAHRKHRELVYQRTFSVNGGFLRDITLLHIGAADQCCKVYLNGNLVGEHQGGYLPAEFDISRFITEGENRLQISVTDSLSYLYPTGKQRKKRGGIWYTPISGIWQTVWLESVDKNYIKNVYLTPDIDSRSIDIKVDCDAPFFEATVFYDGIELAHQTSAEKERCFTFVENDLHLWSPEEPSLYSLTLKTDGDKVSSYFAMRKFTSENGIFLLNNKPYFINGLLDQGYFSDGIYTPASYDAYRDDITAMKSLGFNTLRKHIKVEPMMFYHYCDKLGMLVLQDMVNVGRYSFFKDTVLPFAFKRKTLPYINVSKKQRKVFSAHSAAITDHLYSCPSVVYYTIFNEGWGQFDGDGIYRQLKADDGSRVYDSTSGWFWEKLSDVFSSHIYFKPITPPDDISGTWIVSEFGGYSCGCHGHIFNSSKEFGYRRFDDPKAFEEAFVKLYEEEIIGNMKNGLAGAIYTQLSDVEDEVNGILTYDRKVCKLNAEHILELNEKVYREFSKQHSDI